ncbi:2Fe-2S iron-sulfur cluster binding domain-containing protein [Bradyrhizobium sp. BRP22]|uniref:2Fe-2S iron-sulfur cluster binding domain-containing protein n=1 Tax=Bradyrhizobium sp. BRP22 TaxID=2793821 RepID=UPI001CD23AF3|nr:2Fe-2S iron-sulfur cluster binding domain-containing protein [Bradyrhizobium sp. BRP22]MCA1451604.1 2Fe-2S iron-sulfur cluster binding domain-containing protein [Bradyrhizobium sp. BRP22]
MPRIALNFENGITRFIDAGENESIADAAYRQSVNVPLDCTNGVCGTCKAFRQSGQFDPGSPSKDVLSDAEASEGYILCCQTKARSDMVIDILASSDACKVKPKRTICEVVNLEPLSDHRLRLSVKSLEGELPMFLPGQYVNITVPDEGISRPYSFTSAPGSDVATFLIRNLPNGRMSVYLKARAKRGERLVLDGPFGNFYLRVSTRPVLFIAAGTGVGPFLSMLEYLAMTGNRDQPVRLLYGTRDPADLVELERVEGLRALLPNLSYVTTCSNPASQHQLSGRVTDHMSAEALNHGDADVYLCGPPEMVESARQHAAKCGSPPANIYFEKFAPAAATLYQP